MTCPACVIAETNPNTGLREMGCLVCTARYLADSLMAAKAIAGDTDELFEVIRAEWKDDEEVGRAAVREWIRRLRSARAPPK